MHTIFSYFCNCMAKKGLKREDTVCFNIKTSWHAISRMYNAAGAEYDVGASLGYVLLNIDLEEGTPATKIGPILGMEARSMTRMLKSMEENGLIYRQSDANDKRMVRIFLTDFGREKRELAKIAVKAFNKAVRDRISTEKLDAFFDVISEINQIVTDKNLYEQEKTQILNQV